MMNLPPHTRPIDDEVNLLLPLCDPRKPLSDLYPPMGLRGLSLLLGLLRLPQFPQASTITTQNATTARVP